VATERGDRYVLKKVSTFGAADPVRRFCDEARILTYLLQRGVPVAVPLLTDDGKVYTADDEGALCAVFPMLSQGGADDPKLDPGLLRNMGAAIGRMHEALAACPLCRTCKAAARTLPAVVYWVHRCTGRSWR